jgi:N-acetylglucosaminyldiphosphoundecaprenol N-acetyl-beta-D-mannosaminyltransferase
VRHFFLGGVEASLQALAQKAQTIPGFVLAGVHAPPFQPLEQMDFDGMAALLREAGAEMVWVFLGNPKQELFCAEMRTRLPHVLFAAVGAALEHVALEGCEAPALLQRTGLEWAWRVYREPKRLWRRYAATVPQGLWLMARTAATACSRALRGGRQRHLLPGAPA